MSERTTIRRRWALTPDAFERLLDRLGADREIAGRCFEDLRRVLIAYLTYEACREPERFADTVLDRMAKRLSEGDEIANVQAWARAAARLVLQEARLEGRREAELVHAYVAPAMAASPAEGDQRCLEECLQRMLPETRSLIDRYYRSDDRTMVAARKRLAAEYGISLEALRNRALRLRRQLEMCLEECRDRLGSA